MHRRVGSHALHLYEPQTPLSWSMVAARAFEGAIILIAWSALYFGIKHYGTVEEQRNRLLASEATAREAQLQALRYQLQPHFLFNTLNAISSLVVSKQPERATEMIAKLAALLRTTLSFPEAHLVTLREELAVTEEYLSIEQVRFGPRLVVSLSVSSEAFEAQVPRFLLQPIVENSIRHGIARCPNGGEVSITASVIEGQLRIDIENDRTEGLLQSGDEGNGLGLANTKTRLEKLYGEQGSVTATTAQNNRFLVSIQFPLTTASSSFSRGRTMNIRVLVVDDEPLARVGITTRLSAYSDMLVVGECSTGEEARAKIPQVSPDLIFVDVEMPGISGLDLLRELPREQARCIVFLTAHEEYALDAFNVEALDYLLKPIDDARFGACIERARRMLALHRQEANFERLYGLLAFADKEANRGSSSVFQYAAVMNLPSFRSADVDWIEGLGDYAGLHVGDRTHLVREPLTVARGSPGPDAVRTDSPLDDRPGGTHCAHRSIGKSRCSSNAARRQNVAREPNLSLTSG